MVKCDFWEFESTQQLLWFKFEKCLNAEKLLPCYFYPDRYAYAAISRTKLRSVLNNVKGEKIKGVKTIVEGVR